MAGAVPGPRRRVRAQAASEQAVDHGDEVRGQPPGVGRGALAVLLDAGGVALHAVGQVVDLADHGVGEPGLAGEDALGGPGHADEVGEGGEQADLGGGLEAGPAHHGVGAAVDERRRRGPSPRLDDPAAPRRVDGRHAVAVGGVVERRVGA